MYQIIITQIEMRERVIKERKRERARAREGERERSSLYTHTQSLG